MNSVEQQRGEAMKTMTQKEPRMAATQQARPVNYVLPPVNIFETKDGYVLEAEMPGVSKEGLEITLEGNEITIVGHRHDAALSGSALFEECSLADYRRVFELDPAIDASKVAAKMDQGVLTLTLPKSEKVTPRRIAVD